MTGTKNWWKRGVDAFVNSVGYFILKTSPLTGPLPSVYILTTIFEGWASLLVVVCVECIGYSIGEVAVQAVKRKILPGKYVLAGTVAYLATIEGMMLGYKVIPTWTLWSHGTVTVAEAIQASVSILYPFFTLAGAILYAFREHLDGLETKEKLEEEIKTEEVREATLLQITDKKAEAEARRQRKQQEWEDDRNHKLRLREIELANLQVVQPVRTGSEPVVTSAENGQPDPELRELQLLMLPLYQADPSVSLNKLVVATGKNKPLLHKALKNLADAGIVEITKEGRGQRVTVNGKYDQFMEGE